jgi:RNA polymerase sigma-70 factor (ECF subfamily)
MPMTWLRRRSSARGRPSARSAWASRSTRGWRASVNLSYSLHRRRKRRPETSIEPLIDAGHQWGVDDDPADHAITRERDALLEEAFQGLKPEHQVVLGLRATQDLSYDEIAKTLRVPVGTVMSRLSRARAELKERLAARTGESS